MPKWKPITTTNRIIVIEMLVNNYDDKDDHYHLSEIIKTQVESLGGIIIKSINNFPNSVSAEMWLRKDEK